MGGRTRGRERFITEQLAYSILARHAEAAVLPTAARYRLGVLVWSPLNGGWLTGKYRAAARPADSRAGTNGDHFDFRDAASASASSTWSTSLTTIAEESGLTLIELALGFVLAHPRGDAAIIGPRTLEQLAASPGEPAEAVRRRAGPDRRPRRPGHDVNPADAGYGAGADRRALRRR